METKKKFNHILDVIKETYLFVKYWTKFSFSFEKLSRQTSWNVILNGLENSILSRSH